MRAPQARHFARLTLPSAWLYCRRRCSLSVRAFGPTAQLPALSFLEPILLDAVVGIGRIVENRGAG